MNEHSVEIVQYFPAPVAEASFVGPQFNATWIHQLPQLFYENAMCELHGACEPELPECYRTCQFSSTLRFVGHALSVFALFALALLAAVLFRLPRGRATRRIQRFPPHVARSTKFAPKLCAIEEEELGEFLELLSIQSSFTAARLLQRLREAVDSEIPPSPPLLHPAADPTILLAPLSIADLPTHEAADFDAPPCKMARSLSRSQSRLQFPPHVPIKTLKARVPRLCSRTAPEEGQLNLPTASPGSVVPRIAPLSPSVAPAQRRLRSLFLRRPTQFPPWLLCKSHEFLKR
ncbi:hypothetical protein C8J57DRAFT_1631964 [Mycena rebaudengoi]|nr:hypothetical protein C8J57DRAFT_1631964 [Mycena rebaudengoi]